MITLIVARGTNSAIGRDGEYVRRPDIDKDGYLAFESDRGQRGYLALFKQSPSGGLEVASVADADYFGVADYIAIFRRTDGEAPTAGFTNYTGRYNGGIQTNAGGDITLVEGDILVELDFEDGYVEGDIFNRRTYATVVTDPITLDLVHMPIAGENLPNYGFRRTDLNANGVYENGSVFDSASGTNYGDYSGVIGGTDDPNTAADESGFETAGIVEINRGGTTEIGTFIATCTALPDGDGTVCP